MSREPMLCCEFDEAERSSEREYSPIDIMHYYRQVTERLLDVGAFAMGQGAAVRQSYAVVVRHSKARDLRCDGVLQ